MADRKPSAEKVSAEIADIEAYMTRMRANTAPAWLPDPGSTLAGEVFKISAGRDSGYGVYPVITYKVITGSDQEFVSVHAFHTLLRERLRELGTKCGSRQIMTYLGIQKKNNPTEDEIARGLDRYHMYYVEDMDHASENAADFEI